jgi:hypothetical protein
MKTVCALALLALAVACHLDKLLTGGTERRSRGTPVGLVFRAEPTPARAGQPLDPVRVALVDSLGTPVAGADSLITIALGTNSGSGTLSGTDTAHAVNGVATFSDLRIDQPGTYTLRAAGGGFPPRDSKPFDVMPPPLPSGNHLEFTDLPRTMQVGQVMPPVRITVYDASGGQVRDFTGDIAVSIGANPGNGTLAGTKVVAMHPSLGGVGEWLDLSIDQPGNGYTLLATAAGVGSATSDPFDITAGPPPPLAGATGLGFLDEPTTTRAGATIPPFRVVATDDAGNTATGFSGAIWITLASNPGGATLSGTRRLVAVNGMVTFSDLSINRPGSGYTLHVSYWPLRFKNSTPFTVTP